jgi:hypothetical protein
MVFRRERYKSNAQVSFVRRAGVRARAILLVRLQAACLSGAAAMTADEIIARLDGVRERGPGRWSAKCPAHEDRSPSLSIRECDDGTILLHDFGGCDALSIVGAIGIEFADLFPARNIRRVDHRERPRIPASERLELLEHEIGVALFIATDFLANREISDDDYARLVQAVARIGSSKHG